MPDYTPPTMLNPVLRPIAEAKPGDVVLLYSFSVSPMYMNQIDASVEFGLISTGKQRGCWTRRFGFFEDFKGPNGFEFTHYFPVPTGHVERVYDRAKDLPPGYAIEFVSGAWQVREGQAHRTFRKTAAQARDFAWQLWDDR